ncbi:hypothetical protein NL108_011819, partial [Boleophthalmus pectinirostris]
CVPQRCDSLRAGTIYEYQAKTLNGSQTVSLDSLKGRVVLFINFLLHNLTNVIVFFFPELNALHEELQPHGLTILGFPSNQFGKQEPGQNHEILPGLQYVRPGNGFVPNFRLFEKGDVNGQNEQPVYTFLKSACPPVGDTFGKVSGRLFWEPLKVNDIKWNFEKFLVSRDGKPVMRWHPSVEVSEIRTSIILYLHSLSQRRQ